VNAAVLEGEPRTVKQIHDRRRDQDHARIRSAHDPSRCVDREPADVAGDLLDLSGVNACADDEAKALSRVADGSRAPNGTLGAIEPGQHAVAGGLDEVAAMPIDRHRGLVIVLADEVAPAFGAKLRRTEGRVDDIGEHDGCEDAFVSLITLLPVRPHRLEVDRDPWLVPDHPRIMSWRDLEDIARADLEFRAVRIWARRRPDCVTPR